MDALLNKYYTSNDVSLSFMTPLPKEHQNPYNDNRDSTYQQILKNTKEIYDSCSISPSSLDIKLKDMSNGSEIEAKEIMEKVQNRQEEIKAKHNQLQKIIDDLFKAEIDDKVNQSVDVLIGQILNLSQQFSNVEQIKLIRRLYDCNDMEMIIRDWDNCKKSMIQTLDIIRNHLQKKSPLVIQLRLSPPITLETLANDGSLMYKLSELAVFGAIRDYNKELQLNIPKGIRGMINAFYPGLTLFDKILELISNSLNDMNDIEPPVIRYEHFFIDLSTINIDFYKQFETEITGIYERFGVKSMNEYLSMAQENPSMALTNYATNLHKFYESKCKNQNSTHLEITYNEKILRLFVDTVSTKYSLDGYDNMILDIENGYEDLTSDLRADIVKIYKLFKRLDVGEAKKINDAFKRF